MRPFDAITLANLVSQIVGDDPTIALRLLSYHPADRLDARAELCEALQKRCPHNLHRPELASSHN